MDPTILAERKAAAAALTKASAVAIAENLGIDVLDLTVPTGDVPPDVVALFGEEKTAAYLAEIAAATKSKAAAPTPKSESEDSPKQKPK